MRITGGEVRGLTLRMPKGRETRPTSDKVREAIFNVVGARVQGAAVLDLYAGTGALGIEALSRGAETADFVESGVPAWKSIEANLDTTRFSTKGTIWRMDVRKALERLDRPFDLVLLDPPYDSRDIHDVMAEIGRVNGITAPAGIAVLEHSRRFETGTEYGRLVRQQVKRYGDTSVSFYRADA